MRLGKQVLISLYAFSKVENTHIEPEDVIIDVLLFSGPELHLKQLGNNLQEKSYLIFDGEEYLLIVEREAELGDLDKIDQEYASFGVKLNKDPLRMIVLPNTLNVKTKQYCKVIWKKEK